MPMLGSSDVAIRCKATTTPGTNVDFWGKRLDKNIARDRVHAEALQGSGWMSLGNVLSKAVEPDPGNVAMLVKGWLESYVKILVTLV